MALVKIITGGFNCGKTTTAEKLMEEYTAEGQRAAGFIAEAEYTNGEKNTYYIRDISTGRRELAVCLEPPQDCRPGEWKKHDFSRFYFSEGAFIFAAEILEGAVGADFVMIDELGPLELGGGGSFYAVKRLIDNYEGTIILVIREKILEEMVVLLGLNIEEVEIINPEAMPSR